MYQYGDKNFLNDIKKFNEMYGQPSNDRPTLISVERLENFKSVLMEEFKEIDGIIKQYREKEGNLTEEDKLEILTSLSDWLGDIIVYANNEARKHGLPMDKILEIIMESNFSKLGEDGMPIRDERGKVIKGPNYWAPEEKIKDYLQKLYSERHK